MLSLADRHEDRAARKAANRAENIGGNTGSVATAEAMFRDAMAARARLTEDEQAELEASLKLAHESGEFTGSARSLSEAPDGSGDTMAGIGVVNVAVVPGATLASSQAGNGGGADGGEFASVSDAGWGATPPVTEAPLPAANLGDGNAAGASLAEQGAVDTKAAGKASKAKAE